MSIEEPFTYTVKFDSAQIEILQKVFDKLLELKVENATLKRQIENQEVRLAKLESN